MMMNNTYIGDNGLLYCDTCHMPREMKFPMPMFGKDYIVHVMCACEKEAYDIEQKHRQRRDFEDMVARNRSVCFSEKQMYKWSFEEDNGSVPAMEKAKAYVDEWDRVLKKNIGLLLWGGVGSGKTFMAAAIANALLDQGYKVLMRDFAQISNISVFDSEEYVKSLSDYSLLILDDLGAERKSEFAMQNVFNVINRRWESGKPLIVTTNLTLAEMKAKENLQELRIYDRIFSMCTPLCVNGESKRLEKDQQNKEILKEIFKNNCKL